MLVVHPASEMYGADRAVLQTVRALVDEFVVTVALPSRGPLSEELARAGARVVTCSMPVLRRSVLSPRGAAGFLWDFLRGVVPSLRLLRAHADGGVLVNTVTLPTWPLLARVAGRRVVCHVHEAEESAGRVARIVVSLGPLFAHRVVVNSEFTRRVLALSAPGTARRAVVVLNSVPGPEVVVDPRAAITGPLRLVYVGRLSPRKGVGVAVDVVHELSRRGVDVRLTVVGAVFEGYEWFGEELRRQVEAGPAGTVSLVGFQSDVWPYLADADVVLVPAVGEESFGNTVIEAMLAARPAVVSDTSGLREAAAPFESARLVMPAAVGEWADSLEQILAGWSAWRAAALLDRVTADARHGQVRYALDVVEVMRGLGRGQPDQVSDEEWGSRDE